jgi:RNA polymerase sigma factor (sigma-70 family)
VDRYKGLVYSVPRRYKLGPDLCEEVFQNVFTAMLRSLPRLRDTEGLPKWLMVTTHRECWRLVKASRARPASLSIPEIPEDAPPDEALLKWERQHLVNQALEKLGGRCEKLLRAIFLDPAHPSYAAIAERLRMPVGSIGPVRARCLDKLLGLLSDVR